MQDTTQGTFTLGLDFDLRQTKCANDGLLSETAMLKMLQWTQIRVF